jgi:hypothetical protein
MHSYKYHGFQRQWNLKQIMFLVSALYTVCNHSPDPDEYHYSELQSVRPYND